MCHHFFQFSHKYFLPFLSVLPGGQPDICEFSWLYALKDFVRVQVKASTSFSGLYSVFLMISAVSWYLCDDFSGSSNYRNHRYFRVSLLNFFISLVRFGIHLVLRSPVYLLWGLQISWVLFYYLQVFRPTFP